MCEAGGGPARRWSGCWWPRRSRRTRRPRSCGCWRRCCAGCSAARREAQCRRPPTALATRLPAWRCRRPPAGPCKPPGPGNQQKEPGTDQAFQHCWRAFPGVPGAGGRTQIPAPAVVQLRDKILEVELLGQRVTSRTLRRSWY